MVGPGFLGTPYIYMNAFILAFGVWAIVAPDSSEAVLMVSKLILLLITLQPCFTRDEILILYYVQNSYLRYLLCMGIPNLLFTPSQFLLLNLVSIIMDIIFLGIFTPIGHANYQSGNVIILFCCISADTCTCIKESSLSQSETWSRLGLFWNARLIASSTPCVSNDHSYAGLLNLLVYIPGCGFSSEDTLITPFVIRHLIGQLCPIQPPTLILNLNWQFQYAWVSEVLYVTDLQIFAWIFDDDGD